MFLARSNLSLLAHQQGSTGARPKVVGLVVRGGSWVMAARPKVVGLVVRGGSWVMELCLSVVGQLASFVI